MMGALPVLAGLLLASPQAAPPQSQATPMTMRDPAVLEAQLRDMGYAPERFVLKGVGKTASTTLTVRDSKINLVMGGCTVGRDCTYVVLVGSFNDVIRPPAKWVAEQNVEFDMIKVWTADDGMLSYSSGAVVEGMPREAFRAWLDLVVQSSNDLAAEAVKAKLVKE